MGSIEVGEILTVMDQDDREQEIEVISLLTIEDKKYAAVAFAGEEQVAIEEIDVFFFRILDGEELMEIETDAEFEKVSAVFSETQEA